MFDVFPDEILKQADAIPQQVDLATAGKRLDLRDKLIFTIDGDDAKDFDDAVSLEKLDNGHYLLGVHIADVSHYVTPDSPLDAEAFRRGTSVYFPGHVVPMLPFALSNGICSLNPTSTVSPSPRSWRWTRAAAATARASPNPSSAPRRA